MPVIIAVLFLLIVGGLVELYFNVVHHQAPLIWSRRRVRQAVIKNVDLKPGQVFCELGAGAATLVRHLAKQYPSNKFIAVDHGPFSFILGRLLSLPYPNISWRQQNFFKLNLADIDYFYCFLNVQTMIDLEPKFLREAKPGAVIISYIFKLPNLTPHKTLDIKNEKIYFYKIPEH